MYITGFILANLTMVVIILGLPYLGTTTPLSPTNAVAKAVSIQWRWKPKERLLVLLSVESSGQKAEDLLQPITHHKNMWTRMFSRTKD